MDKLIRVTNGELTRKGDRAIYTPIKDFECKSLGLTVNRDYEGEIISDYSTRMTVRFINDEGKELIDSSSEDCYIACTSVVAMLTVEVYTARVMERYNTKAAKLSERFAEDLKELQDQRDEALGYKVE